MIGTSRGVYLQRPRFHDEPVYRDTEGDAFRQRRDRFLIDLLQQRHASNPGRHSPFGHMSSHTPPISLMPGMASMVGGHGRYNFSTSMDLSPDIALGFGMGMMGTGPHMVMGHESARPVLSHQPPYIRKRHSPFSYNSPGPPRAHSFIPTHRSTHRPTYSSFRGPSHSPFSSPRTTMLGDADSDDDDFEDDHFFPSRRRPGRHSRRNRHASRYPLRCRRYRSSMFEDSEDELEEYDDYEDDFDNEDALDGYFSRRGHSTRWRRGH